MFTKHKTELTVAEALFHLVLYLVFIVSSLIILIIFFLTSHKRNAVMTDLLQIPPYPAQFNLEQNLGFATVNNTPKLRELSVKVDDAAKRNSLARKGKIAISAAVFLLLWFLSSGGFIVGLIYGVILFAILSIPTFILGKIERNLRDKYWEGEITHLAMVRDEVSAKLGGKGYAFRNGSFFVMHGEGFLYGDVYSGHVIGYNKKNVKEVMLEHVNLGSTTVGTSVAKTKGSYGGSSMSWGNSFSTHSGSYKGTTTTQMNSQTTVHYEWRLDILTDFLDFPKVSLTFNDSPEAEADAKTIYAILKP